MNQNDGHCPICYGLKSSGTTTFTVDLGFGIVVVRDVPATICEQCGAEWIEDEIAEKLEEIVQDAKEKHTMIEVATFADLKKAS
ncbi:MAG: YgiT-type zinc finger domain-containing protein [Hydrogenimonas sp.]|nr:MAG: YgiT-type zinc finger domain-containing protein [Hydrogenimonas sp.]